MPRGKGQEGSGRPLSCGVGKRQQRELEHFLLTKPPSLTSADLREPSLPPNTLLDRAAYQLPEPTMQTFLPVMVPLLCLSRQLGATLPSSPAGWEHITPTHTWVKPSPTLQGRGGGHRGRQGVWQGQGKGGKGERDRWGTGMGHRPGPVFLLGLPADSAGKLLPLAPAQVLTPLPPCNGLILRSAKSKPR